MKRAFLAFCARVGLWFIERGILQLERAFLAFCACVGLWFIERGILHLKCAFLGFCTCVGLWFIEPQAAQTHYAWVGASEVIWSEYIRIISDYLMPNKCKNLKDVKYSCLSICTSNL